MTSFSQKFNLPTEEALLMLANSWGKALAQGAIVYLQGTLGAGKTTFSRGLLH
ncbi:MAG: tRNA threonylcarbamoyladenosine biosynthesis protein TsaE, partial [Flavobacteriales bacterium]